MVDHICRIRRVVNQVSKIQSGVSIMKIFERGKCYVIAYRKGGVGKSPFRSVLVCSVRGGVVYAIPVEKLVEYNAEKKVCEDMGIPMFRKRPEPQTFLIDRIKFGRSIANYSKYMERKVSEIVELKLASLASAR